ncbi:MAG: flippase-like domain-containing protein [Flavobacteriales bacterium]|nr:flippase-like domain-containing protein [Flavobacteriales bacterium]
MAKLKAKSALKFLLKFCLSAVAIYLVFSKIELQDVWSLIKTSNPLYLTMAALLFNVSKWISSARLLKLFHSAGSKISWKYNLKLYYVGMFYNLFLPGGIGGDGYKVYLLGKSQDVKRRDLLAAVLLDRISGAALLVFLALLISVFTHEIIDLLPENFFFYLMIAGLVLAIPSLVALVKLGFKKFQKTSFHLVHLSFWVQVVQLICAGFILLSFGVEENFELYFVLFLVSSIAAMLPLSFGGVGLRELVFLYAANELPIDGTSAVALGLIFFLITALSSFVGVFLRLPPNTALNKNER